MSITALPPASSWTVRSSVEASLRIGLGRFTTEAEIDFAAERLIAAQRQLRAA